MKDLEGSRTGHVSWSSEVGGMESGDGVGGSLEVRGDLGMARNTGHSLTLTCKTYGSVGQTCI